MSAESVRKQSGGLAGVVAGQTSISTVGKAGVGLTYRGYAIEELGERSGFEEVAHLLLHGHLPAATELESFLSRLMAKRGLPEALRATLERVPAAAHPMDVLRTGCSMLGTLEPEADFSVQGAAAERLVAVMPSMLLYWHRFHREGVRSAVEAEEERTVAGHFLRLLHGAVPAEEARRAMDVALILYAEHELNASTFAVRVATSTLSDMHSAITAGIGTLRGPLHGGANEAAMELIQNFATPDEAERGLMERLESKQLIMGFGHRVYRTGDPRSPIVKDWAKRLSRNSPEAGFFHVAERIETVMWERKQLFPNLDFYSALVFRYLKIPTALFTPIFVCARVAGWAAHVMEQRADNRLIRPTADYIGPEARSWVPPERRATN